MQVDIDLQVTFDTPFSIGSGAQADSVADKPLAKDAGRRPLVPGSSLKGKIRHECERIIRALIHPWPGDWGCEAPYPARMCKGPNFCPVCRVFGAPWRPALITFDDLVLAVANGAVQPRDWKRLHAVRETDTRPGVAINRERGVAEDDLLYSTETYAPPPGLVYRGRIWGTLQERREVALVVAGLQSVAALGGARSRGLGWWQLQISIRLDGQPCGVEELLRELEQWSN